MPTEPDSTGGDQSELGGAPWVTVSNKRGRKRGRHAVDRAINFHASPGPQGRDLAGEAGPRPIPTDVGLNDEISVPAYVEAEHARVVAWWRNQPSYTSLVDLIKTHAPGRAVVTRAVCLGAGSFGGPLDFGESIRRAHIQTEAFLSIVKVLGEEGGQAIECFFQEPLYTGSDKAYLRSLGHSVVETPAASQMITPTTMVFAIHLPTREYLDCLCGVVPAMLVGTGFGRYEELPQFLGDDTASQSLGGLRHVHRTFHSLQFPREDHDYCFSDTVIYWRSQEKSSS